MLKVNNICKKINDNDILININFAAKSGNQIGIIGPHNSGKTTLMNILAGIMLPSSGNVEYNYQNIFNDLDIRVNKYFGYASQYFTFYPNMKVYEFLDHVCILNDILDLKERQLEIESLLEKFDMQNFRNMLISSLSRSNKQIVNLMQAFIGNPKIVLFDEPTLGIDPEKAEEIRLLLKEMTSNKITIVASHILPEVTSICSELIAIDHGKIIATEKAKKLTKDYCQRNILLVRTEGDYEAIRYSFDSLPEVIESSIIDIDKKRFTLKIELTKDSDIRKEVFQKLSNLHMPIHKMTLEPLTLEDLFSRLEIYNALPTIKETPKVIDIKTKKAKENLSNDNFKNELNDNKKEKEEKNNEKQ